MKAGELKKSIDSGLVHPKRERLINMLAEENPSDDADVYNCHTCGHIGTKKGPRCWDHVAPLDCAFYGIQGGEAGK